MSFLNFLNCFPFTYIGQRDFYTRREREKRESEINRDRRETDSVLFYGGLSWIISVTRIKRSIDRYSFSDWFLINILEYIAWCDRRGKEFKVSKYFVNISVLFFIKKCVV